MKDKPIYLTEHEANQLLLAAKNSLIEPRELYNTKREWLGAVRAVEKICDRFDWYADWWITEWGDN